MAALVGETIATDEQLDGMTLQEHDRIHHPDGYHEGDTCKYRDKIKKETPEDKADELPTDNGSKQSGHGGSERGRLSEVADRVKGFIRGVAIKFSDKPYQEAEGDVRKSIKESEQKNWNKILDAFENKNAGADATFHHQLLDHTPAVYQRLGVKNLPITIMGGVIHKMLGNIRNSEYDYHEIPISELRNLLIDLDNPVAVFYSKSDPGALVVLTNILDKHGNLKSVIPLKLERDASGKAKENVIASGYGQKPNNLQDWIDEGYLRYVSKKALRKSAQRLQLPGDSILRAKGVLMENDFSSEQLGDIIPDSPEAVKGGGEESAKTAEVINFRDSQGNVVGTYNRATNEVVLYEGADADTIGHELCGHATWQFAEQQAKKGDDALLRKMNEVVDSPTAKPVWDEVRASYEGEDREVQREEVWAHIIGHETSKAIEEIQKSRSGRRWYQKFWNVVRDAWKGLLSSVRINSVHLEGTEDMSPKEFSEYIVKQMLERKTLGNISKEGGGEEGAERKSIWSKPLVTPEEDAAYMEAVEKGDMETASKMVREAAAKAMPDTKMVGEDGSPRMLYKGKSTDTTKYEGDIYLSNDIGVAKSYVGRYSEDGRGTLMKAFVDMKTPLVIDASGATFDTIPTPQVLLDKYGVGAKIKTDRLYDAEIFSDTMSLDDIVYFAKDAGYDGVEVRDIIDSNNWNEMHNPPRATTYVAFNSRQIKSADPVTYDDHGNVIPLSRRFDDGDDIRGDVSGKSEYIEKMKSLHPDINPNELINRLKGLGSREEMEAEIAKILGKK